MGFSEPCLANRFRLGLVCVSGGCLLVGWALSLDSVAGGSTVVVSVCWVVAGRWSMTIVGVAASWLDLGVALSCVGLLLGGVGCCWLWFGLVSGVWLVGGRVAM